jgi:hypothetical protein
VGEVRTPTLTSICWGSCLTPTYELKLILQYEEKIIMQITCPKCNYLADDADEYGVPITDCPACGIIYARYNPNAREGAKKQLRERIKENKEDQDEMYSKNTNTGQLLGVVGSIILFIGVFTPIVSLPIVGNINFFNNGKSDGVIILFMAILSLMLVLIRKYKLLLISGAFTLSILFYTFMKLQVATSAAKSSLDSNFKGTIFNGLGEMAANAIQIQWGWALLIVGSGLVIASALNNAPKIHKDKWIITFCLLMLITGGSLPFAIPAYQDYQYRTYGNEKVRNFRKAAEKGDALAQYNLGACYINGEGIPKNEKKAFEWINKSAEQGYDLGQYALGAIYADGKGVPANDAKAAEWFRKAAEQGEPQAQFSLGAIYADGKGLEQNDELAVEWYTKAAEKGNASAQLHLGIAYLKGNGIEKNQETAMVWLRKASEQGNKDAENLIDAVLGEERAKRMEELQRNLKRNQEEMDRAIERIRTGG